MKLHHTSHSSTLGFVVAMGCNLVGSFAASGCTAGADMGNAREPSGGASASAESDGAAGSAGGSGPAATSAGGSGPTAPSEGGLGGGADGSLEGAAGSTARSDGATDSGPRMPTNLALNKATIPSSMAVLVDGSSTTGDINFGLAGSFQIDLGQPTLIGRAIFSQVPGHAFAQTVSFSVSDDGQTWKQVWRGTSGNELYMFLEAEISFEPVTARYFQVSYADPFIDGFILENELELYAPNTTSLDLALQKTVTASVSTKYQTPLSAITDGQLGGDPWHSDVKPGSVTVDLGSPMSVNRLRLLSDTHYATTQSSFDLSFDNVNWTSAFPKAGSGMHNIAFEPQEARYVRCTILEVNLSDVGSPGLVVRELQVYGPGTASQ